MSTKKKKKATAVAATFKDLGPKKNPKGGIFVDSMKNGRQFLNPQPLPP